jgi:hypothetical protein
MSILNVALLSKNVGDNDGDNRNNTSQVFVKEGGERRGQKHGGGHHGSHKQGGHKGHRHHCH